MQLSSHVLEESMEISESFHNIFMLSTLGLRVFDLNCVSYHCFSPTQSIGMLSYTFLYETRKCEAIVPTVES